MYNQAAFKDIGTRSGSGVRSKGGQRQAAGFVWAVGSMERGQSGAATGGVGGSSQGQNLWAAMYPMRHQQAQ